MSLSFGLSPTVERNAFQIKAGFQLRPRRAQRPFARFSTETLALGAKRD
jgi:hypothetical protein